MTIPAAIDSIIERKAVVLAALKAALEPTWLVRGSFITQQSQVETEMQTGIVMLTSAGEGNYINNFAMQAREGTSNLVLIAHLMSTSGQDSEQLELKEMTLIEAVKAFCSTRIQGLSLHLIDSKHSAQQAHPYGWVVCIIDVLPPTHNLNK